MRKTRFAAAACLIAVAGCSTTGFMSPAHPFDYVYGTSKGALQASVIKKDELFADEEAYYSAANASNENEKRRLRDKIIGRLRQDIDEFWRRYRSAFFGDSATTKTLFESTTSTLSGAAAITKPSSAASIVSALSAAIGALGTSMDKNFFQQQSAIILLNQMKADVLVYGRKIDEGLTKPTNDYPLPVAMSDLAEYSNSMSVPSALASLNAAAGAQAQSVKNKISEDLSLR